MMALGMLGAELVQPEARPVDRPGVATRRRWRVRIRIRSNSSIPSPIRRGIGRRLLDHPVLAVRVRAGERVA